MDAEKYNGWHNYATWRVNLEIVDGYANSLQDDVTNGYVEKYASVSDLADLIEAYVEEMLFDNGTEDTNDLLRGYARAFLDDVDWYEIAKEWEDELVLNEDDAPEDNDEGE